MSRQKDNIEILNRLYQYVTDNPDIRLGQALVNMEVIRSVPQNGVPTIIDPFYEEPALALKRMNEAQKKVGTNGS